MRRRPGRRPGVLLRPPAVPLVTSDPYLSVWSGADRLTDDVTRHWTRRPHALASLIRVDARAYRLMGNDPPTCPPATVSPCSLSHAEHLPVPGRRDPRHADVHDGRVAARPGRAHRPLSYLTWQVHSVDGRAHAVSIYDSTSSQLAVNKPEQKVQWARTAMGPLTALRVGTRSSRCSRPWATTPASIGAMPTPPRRPHRPRPPSRQSNLDQGLLGSGRAAVPARPADAAGGQRRPAGDGLRIRAGGRWPPRPSRGT